MFEMAERRRYIKKIGSSARKRTTIVTESEGSFYRCRNISGITMSQDALSLVREATITGTTVNYVDNHYIFGHYKFHEATKTCFKRTLNCE